MDEITCCIFVTLGVIRSLHLVGWEDISRDDLILFFAEDMVKLGMEMTISLIKNNPHKIQGGEVDNNSSMFIALTHFRFPQYSGLTGDGRYTIIFFSLMAMCLCGFSEILPFCETLVA